MSEQEAYIGEWKVLACKLKNDHPEMSLREIARTLDKPWATVWDHMSKYLKFREVAVEPAEGEVSKSAKILLLDIECAPTQAFVWGRFDQTVAQKQVIKEGYLLTYSAKWLGEPTIYSNRIYEAENDECLVRELADLMDKADLVVAHNAERFDVPLIKTRMLALGMNPPSPSKIVDTLRMAKREFRFPSNSLDNIAAYLGLARKQSHSGFELWVKCMQMDDEAFEEMLTYNIQDVVVLEQLYMKLRPWYKTHPNVSLYGPADKPRCVCCGSDKLSEIDKKYFTATCEYLMYNCLSCGKQNRGRKNVSEHKAATSLTNVGK
jgi:DNA polymerase elongation subunit (family B)